VPWKGHWEDQIQILSAATNEGLHVVSMPRSRPCGPDQASWGCRIASTREALMLSWKILMAARPREELREVTESVRIALGCRDNATLVQCTEPAQLRRRIASRLVQRQRNRAVRIGDSSAEWGIELREVGPPEEGDGGSEGGESEDLDGAVLANGGEGHGYEFDNSGTSGSSSSASTTSDGGSDRMGDLGGSGSRLVHGLAVGGAAAFSDDRMDVQDAGGVDAESIWRPRRQEQERKANESEAEGEILQAPPIADLSHALAFDEDESFKDSDDDDSSFDEDAEARRADFFDAALFTVVPTKYLQNTAAFHHDMEGLDHSLATSHVPRAALLQVAPARPS